LLLSGRQTDDTAGWRGSVVWAVESTDTARRPKVEKVFEWARRLERGWK